MGTNICKAGLDLGNPVGIRCQFRFRQQSAAFGICSKNGFDQASVFGRSLLCHRPNPRTRWQRDRSGISGQFTHNQLE